MKALINNWKNPVLFKEQLDLNLREISSAAYYPEHWVDFLELINTFKPKSMLDVGCGCGTYYKLCAINLPYMEYIGIDYSIEAISLARSTWGYDGFYVMDYKNLTKEKTQTFDLVHMGALLDVLPNGDEALEHIMSLEPKAILIGRMKLTQEDSHHTVYKAYDKIETYAFYHNENNFINLCYKYGYVVHNRSNNYYLEKVVEKN